MKTIISAGGRFHALQLAHQLDKRNSLFKLFSFSYTARDTQLVAQQHVHNITTCALLDTLFMKLRLAHLINPSQFNNLKDNIFDHLVSKELRKMPNFDLFIGWAHYAEKSLQVAHSKGALIVIESGSSHILEQQRLLEEEYRRWRVGFNPIHPKVVEKMVREYELADYIMTLSTASRISFIRHGVPEHKVLLAPCGVDVGYFMHKPSCHAELVSASILKKPQKPGWTLKQVQGDKSKTPSNKFLLIFVGLINIRKGIPYLLEAWNTLNLPEESTELVLVGSLQKDMAQLLPKLPIKKNVVFYGPTNRETLKQLYYESSAFVLPSVEDGFGMVMGEAMACGLPVICTINTGAPDVIQDGVHGFLVQPQNSAALAEKIAWCYEHRDACLAMGLAGQQRIQDFTWGAYGDKVWEIYKKILT